MTADHLPTAPGVWLNGSVFYGEAGSGNQSNEAAWKSCCLLSVLIWNTVGAQCDRRFDLNRTSSAFAT
jgi:hypothetical protein